MTIMAFATKFVFRFWLSILVAIFCGLQCETISIEDHHQLHRILLRDYSDDGLLLRPANDTSYPVQVGFRFAPFISKLHELNQELTLRGMLELSWEDYRLQWNPSDHKGINETKIHLRRSDVFTIWTPELVLNQSYETDFASFQPESYVARLDYTGLMRWYTLAVTKSLCRMNLLYYPFDKQTCWLTFTTWEYQTTEQVFYLIDDLFNNETYRHYIVDQRLWDVKVLDRDAGNVSYDCDICAGEEQSHVTYVIELTRRHPMLYFFSLIVPCIILSIMTAAVPYLDKVKDADPSTFGLTNMLTLMVFLTYLFSTLPSSSQSLFGIYIVITLFEGMVITLVTVKGCQTVATDDVAKKPQHGQDNAGASNGGGNGAPPPTGRSGHAENATQSIQPLDTSGSNSGSKQNSSSNKFSSVIRRCCTIPQCLRTCKKDKQWVCIIKIVSFAYLLIVILISIFA